MISFHGARQTGFTDVDGFDGLGVSDSDKRRLVPSAGTLRTGRVKQGSRFTAAGSGCASTIEHSASAASL